MFDVSHFSFFPVHSKFVGLSMISVFYRSRGTKDFHLHTCKFQLYTFKKKCKGDKIKFFPFYLGIFCKFCMHLP